MKLLVLALFTFGSLALYAQAGDGGMTKYEYRLDHKQYKAGDPVVVWQTSDKTKTPPTTIEVKTCPKENKNNKKQERGASCTSDTYKGWGDVNNR
jgi:hypothetical protein